MHRFANASRLPLLPGQHLLPGRDHGTCLQLAVLSFSENAELEHRLVRCPVVGELFGLHLVIERGIEGIDDAPVLDADEVGEGGLAQARAV